MLTNLPRRPRSLNSTTPVTLANSVSSLPNPTFSPGLIGVPRCRTMIDPPGTSCPPKRFTPRRCALESRPFLELPKPFLCAMELAHDVADAHFGVILPVPLGPLILLLSLELENQDLLGAIVIFDRRVNFDIVCVLADHHFIGVVKECQDAAKLDFRADLSLQIRDANNVAGGNAKLPPACLNNCL